MTTPSLLILSEAADELRVSVRTLEREHADGKIAFVLVRRRRLVARAELDRYIAAREVVACPSEKLAIAGRSVYGSAVERALKEHSRPAPAASTRRRSRLWSDESTSTLRLVAGRDT